MGEGEWKEGRKGRDGTGRSDKIIILVIVIKGK